MGGWPKKILLTIILKHMMQVYILVYCSWSSAFNFDFQSMASGDKYNKLDEDYEIQVQEYIKLTLQIKWGI